MKTDTFLLLFCLTIVILGVVISPATAAGNTTFASPVVSGISPSSGTTAGGTPVTITGTGLTNMTAVTFGTTAVTTFTSVSATSVTVTSPAGTTGTIDVTVTTAAGTSAISSGDKFTYTALAPIPIVTGISPSSGTTAGGTSVTITGTGLTGVTAVTFGSTAVTTFTAASATSVTAASPAGTSGTVDITVTTAGGTSAVSTADRFTYAAVPVAAFSATPVTGTAPLVVQFSDASTNGPLYWGWSFGDGNSSTVQNPSYTYPAAGTYSVTLTATNAAGSNVCTKSSLITVTGIPTDIPVPAFTATPVSGTAPLTVQFDDESAGSPTTWNWSFGDGNTSTLEAPSYTYVDDGTYSVTLTETNAMGSNVTTMTGFIAVGTDTVPEADFSASPTGGTAPLVVTFTDTSSGSPTAWTWDFGDGTTGTAENPSHTYSSAGTYSVSLVASNTAGSNMTVQPDYITVSAATVTPEVTYTESYTQAPAPAGTYAIPVTTSKVTDANSAWVEEENKKMAAMDAETTANASGLPPVIPLISIVCVAFFVRKKYR